MMLDYIFKNNTQVPVSLKVKETLTIDLCFCQQKLNFLFQVRQALKLH